MKILYLSHTSQVSGGEHALLSLLAHLPTDFEPAVACPPGALAGAVEGLGVPVFHVSGTRASLKLHPIHTSRGLVDIGRTAVAIRSVSRRFGADLLHANSIRAGVIAVLARRIGGPPPLVHVHDRLPSHPASRAALSLIATGASGILACSKYVLEQFPRGSIRAPVHVAYNPVDTGKFDPARVDRSAARTALGLAEGEFALSLVGQITPLKAQDDAVRMMAELKQRHPNMRLLLVGSAKFVGGATRYDNSAFSRDLNELVASLGVEAHVQRLGERSDVPEILRASDLYLAPSWQEAFSFSVLEAMAMQLPVLVTSFGGMGEIVDGHNGILLPPREPERWAHQIERLTRDPAARDRMGQRARHTVSNRLEATTWAEAVAGTYGALLERPTGYQGNEQL